jgi:hypothetical protein
MIYESLQSTFRSVEGLLYALRDGMRQYSAHVRAAASNDLLVLSNRVHAQAQYAATQTGQARQQPDLLAAIGFGQAQVDQILLAMDPIRQEFDRIAAPLGASGDRTRCEDLFTNIDEALRRSRQDLEESGTTPQGPAVNLARIRGTVDDLAAYPILTSDSSSFGGSLGGPTSSAGGTGTDVRRTVDLAMRDVLGRLPKYTDATAFTSALAATFQLSVEQGHTVVVWRPRGFVGQTELGGSVSGAQASLYARAQDALSSALPVLHGLTPLRPDADVQEMDAARSVIESEFTALVGELGTAGGARIPRVEGLFGILLNDTVVGLPGTPASAGMLRYLADVMGLDRGFVNTIEEERVFSNYLLLRDYVTTTQNSWTLFRTEFDGRDLGTLLVLLSNALQVVAEAVDEVGAALDSVFVGTGEQTVARFSIGGGASMLVSELLSWVSSFAVQEAPELVQEGGRRAMGAVQRTATDLIGLLQQLIVAAGSDPGLPAGMRHPRVRHPLEELRTYLRQVTQIAADVQTN